MSLYACLSALFWTLCRVASLLLDNAWVGTGGYSMIGSTSCLYRCTLVLALAVRRMICVLLYRYLFLIFMMLISESDSTLLSHPGRAGNEEMRSTVLKVNKALFFQLSGFLVDDVPSLLLTALHQDQAQKN